MSNNDLDLMHEMMNTAPESGKPAIKTEDFDALFDSGGDIAPFVDANNAARPNQKVKRVNVDFPLWMVESLDREAQHLGVTRQALVKVWIANCLAHEAHTARR